MHSNVTIKNVSWPHFSWATLYVVVTIPQQTVLHAEFIIMCKSFFLNWIYLLLRCL